MIALEGKLFGTILSRIKNVLNYFEKLFTNEEKKMNTSCWAVSGRGP